MTVLIQIPRLPVDPEKFGQPDDPLVGKPVGGVIVFGGGLALYDKSGKIVGGLGVSGDTSCADHVIAWKTRQALGLNAVPMGVAPARVTILSSISRMASAVAASDIQHAKVATRVKRSSTS